MDTVVEPDHVERVRRALSAIPIGEVDERLIRYLLTDPRLGLAEAIDAAEDRQALDRRIRTALCRVLLGEGERWPEDGHHIAGMSAFTDQLRRAHEQFCAVYL